MRGTLLRPLTLLLLVACLVLGYGLLPPPPQLALELASPPRAIAEDASITANTAPVLPLNDYREVWDRPLFSPDRRPKPVERAVPVAAAKLTFTLEGVVLSGDSQRVLVRSRRNQLQRLTLGERVDGWELVAVEASGARFSRSGRTVEVLLKKLAKVD